MFRPLRPNRVEWGEMSRCRMMFMLYWLKFSVMSAISVRWLNASWGAVYTRPYYGLMQHSFIEIKNKLLRALDAEYNVVDMGTVFEVVAVLEKTPITTEILETTRLGRLINECRRRTKNEVLAKRAKHLLRNWRNLMIDRNNSSVLSPSASIPSSVPTTIAVSQQNGTVAKSVPYGKADRLPTPSISPALSASSSHSRNSGGNVYDSKISPSCSLSPVGDPKVESVPKTHVANKRLRKNASSAMSGEPPAKKSKMNGTIASERHTLSNEDLFDSGVDSVHSRVSELTPVTEDRAQDAVSSLEATVVTESVPEPDPPLPKRRSRKKNSKKKSQADDIVKEKLVALSKTGRVKTTEELVADLKSRTVSGGTDDSVGLISVKTSLSNNVSTDHVFDNAVSSSGISAKKNIEAKLDPETQVECEIRDILSKLPPLNVEHIVWDSPECSTPPTPKPITDADVDRYLQQEWDGVNGCVTEATKMVKSDKNVKSDENAASDERAVSDENAPPKSSFRGWHEMIARKTMNDDLIHILPYSIVD